MHRRKAVLFVVIFAKKYRFARKSTCIFRRAVLHCDRAKAKERLQGRFSAGYRLGNTNRDTWEAKNNGKKLLGQKRQAV